ncbi:hypothetical protein AMAG_20739 [Allomyces macrogynus ATCC 38327]|uniref:Major facilitator superfamily (MFS) profile domain-containing protein n=1 Tax=Allomyces macrogynus (strain ATCC 38327) TaxID=578462 RepID=A0A0L0TEW6_ALLM3|nr:hypothetical protein AMAG_20739 [Allomyces macrogynus ATCC 38327]|eukprot:KNE73287.1 hypothetical protein AMAG_20739 [Allomyces macrogynus ATCC 38327]
MWRTALALQAAPGALLMVMLVVMPESPRWLMLREREEEALTNLARLRQQDERSPAVQEEFHDYKQSIETERQVGTAAWSELGRKGILNRLFQQWTGINAVLYYSASLFIAMGIPKSTAITVNVVVQSLINVLFHSEIFPLRVRSKGTGIAAASNWINNFILSYVWPYAETLGANQYIVFGTTGLAMAAFTAWYVPETRGKSLEEMDEVFGFAEDAYPMTDLKAQ